MKEMLIRFTTCVQQFKYRSSSRLLLWIFELYLGLNGQNEMYSVTRRAI